MEKCRAVKTERTDCQIELENQFDYKQGYWVSKDTTVTLEGISWISGYPELRTNLIISVKFEALIENHLQEI